jgi:hypothetical protein
VEGLLEESLEAIEDVENQDELIADLALIAAAQKPLNARDYSNLLSQIRLRTDIWSVHEEQCLMEASFSGLAKLETPHRDRRQQSAWQKQEKEHG